MKYIIMNKIVDNKCIELLSPAGSFECAKAALLSGADAIYMGGDRFSARAFAKSATEEKLIDSIKFVKDNGKRFYLTVNTLFKQKELKEIFLFLDPLVEYGVDAFIIQDLGVAMLLKNRYKNVEKFLQFFVVGMEKSCNFAAANRELVL